MRGNELVLQDSAMFLQKIFDQAAFGMAIIDNTGAIKKVNQKFCDIIGYTYEEIINKNFRSITSPDDNERDEKIIHSINEEGIDSVDIEKRYIHKSGRIVWVHIYLTVIRDDQGKYLYGTTIVNDITDQKKAEENIKESEERYRLLFQNMKDACMICEPIWNDNYNLVDYKVVDINPSFERLFCTEDKEVKGLTVKSFFPNMSDTWLEFLENTIITETENKLKIYYEDRKKYLAITSFRFRENQFALVIEDYTEQKTGHDEILIQKKLLDETFDAITDGIIITDQDRIIQKCNKGVLKTYGYTAEELIGKSVEVIYLNRDDFVRSGEETFSDKNIFTGTPIKMLYRKKDGAVFLGETYGRRLYSDDGKYIGNFGLTRDITQRENLLRELVETKEKAVESDRLKSAFLANMSHEIRTPMNGILGFAELLNKENLTERARKRYVEIINASSKQLLNIVDDIIDISKIETGQIDIYNSEIVINTFLFDLYTFFKPVANKKSIQLFLEIELPDDIDKICTDAIKLRQIMNNLISNAIKFTSVGSVKIGCRLVDDMLEFFVSDTGIGISPDHHENIFDRFRQVEHPENRKYGGTGLGLSITKAFIEKLGGEIYLDSEKGKGSTFKFTLPYFPQTVTALPEVNSFYNQDIKCTVMVVEDEDVNFLYLKEILERRSMNVIRATDGIEAVEKCSEHQDISLVLMDIKLPGMNGYEATRAIKEKFPRIKVIAQTAYALASGRKKAYEVGFDEYLTKPITIDKLMNTIYNVMNSTNDPARKQNII